MALVFFSVLALYMAANNREREDLSWSRDTVWSVYTSLSIVKEGNTDLDEFRPSPEDDYSVARHGDHIYSIFPVGTPIVATPLVFVMDSWFDFAPAGSSGAPIPRLAKADYFIASFITALTAVFIFLIGQLFLKKTGFSLLLVFIFACCTSSWSVASRTLWQHGSSMLMLTIALYLILMAGRRPSLVQFASLPLFFSLAIRPTNAIPMLLLSVFVLLRHRKLFWRYLLWGAAVLAFLALFNLKLYGAVLSPYYQPERLQFVDPEWLLTALAGNLISPSRGLFVFSPVLLFAVVGIALKIRNRQMEQLDYFIIGIIVLHWLAISLFPHWWGGWSYGPRFFTDMVPLFIYFIIPVLSWFPRLQGVWKPAVAAIFLVSIAFSAFVHYRGATVEATYQWNGQPVNVDRAPGRLWDWSDPQFLRGLK